MMRYVVLSGILLTLGVAVTCAARPAATTLTPEAYLDKAIDIIRDNALYSSHVDWKAVRAEAQRRADGARDTAATYPAIRYVLAQLGDHHSFLQLDAAHRARERQVLGGKYVKPTPRHARKISKTYAGRKPEFEILAVNHRHKLGYLVMPDTKPGRRDDAISTTYQHGLQKLASASPCGWIVDLRGNDGGNIAPMLAGIGPLLGDGAATGTIDSHGKTGSFIYREGKALYRDRSGKEAVGGEVADPMSPIRPEMPAAVLIDSLTASSGEIIAIAFKGRPVPTRFFGEQTYGASTATAGHLLPDGANLVIAEGLDVDRTGHRYPDGIRPDVPIPDAGSLPSLHDDAAVQAAKAWLSGQPTCRMKV
jgi:C-terminal processing protease CtpA/Prc